MSSLCGDSLCFPWWLVSHRLQRLSPHCGFPGKKRAGNTNKIILETMKKTMQNIAKIADKNTIEKQGNTGSLQGFFVGFSDFIEGGEFLGLRVSNFIEWQGGDFFLRCLIL